MKSTTIALGCALIGLAGCASQSATSGAAMSTGCSAQVSDIVKLTAAIAAANPGTVICLNPGTYDAAKAPGEMIQIEGKNGQVNQPIVLRGQKGVVVTNTSAGKLDAIYINKSSYVGLEDIAIQDVYRAITIDESTRISMSNLLVDRTAQEAIHFRKNTTHSVLINSTIRNVGVDTKNSHSAMKRFAEGIYIGTARSNWAKIMGKADMPDASNNNCVSGNMVGPNIAAEGLDLKEGTTNTYILNNTFDLSGISGHNFADSALDLKGSHIFVGHNKFINTGGSYIAQLMRVSKGKDVPIPATPGKLTAKITPDAIQTHIVPTKPDTASGSNILLWNNQADLKSGKRPEGFSAGMLLRIDDESGKPDARGGRLCKGNSVAAGDQLSNIAETDCTDIPAVKSCPLTLMQP